jgi:hypothetical protein
MPDRFLFKKIDNSPLIIFRIFFGILISLECFGAIATGWVRRTLVEPKFTFTFIGFEWLQPLAGTGMYWYFIVMGILGLLIAFGYKYRFAMISFTLMWTVVYLMQKTAYNNHYYLLILISFIMCFLPANRSHSLDVRQNPSLKTNAMHNYVKWIFVLQLFIVYTFAAIAKLYADWLDYSFIKILMQSKADYYLIGDVLQQAWLHKILVVPGILFDLLIIPALLWKPTRKIAFVCSVLFHLFNSVVFQIGIFPYLSLAFIVFFFEPETIQRLFFKKKAPYLENEIEIPSHKGWLLKIATLYFTIQILLPLRHYVIKDDVLWTEEGHRMSWRMMLRSRSGIIKFKLVNKESGDSKIVDMSQYVSKGQERKVATYPDFIWQFAQYLKKEHLEKGEEISVFATSKVRINGKPFKPFIDPEVDLASERWDHFRHHEWILPYDK